MRFLVWIAAILVSGAISSCSSTNTSRFLSQSYDDDLYFVSSGRALLYADENQLIRESDGRQAQSEDDAYADYLNARRGNNSGISPYDYNERAYDRSMRRHADPMWSNPSLSMGFGMGGFWGGRSYMLYNPYMPPFWSMQPGFSLGWNSMGGMGMGFGMGHPMMMGMGNPWMMGGMYDPWMMGGMGMHNPYWGGGWGMNPWMNPWMNPYMGMPGGGFWAGGDGNRIPVAPPRGGSRVGGALPTQSNLFNPNPRGGSSGTTPAGRNSGVAPAGRTSPSNARMAPGAQPSRSGAVNTPGRAGQQNQPAGRNSMRESRPTPAPSRGNFDNVNRNRSAPSAAPSQRFNNSPSRQPSSTPSRQPSWSSPSRGSDSGFSPSRGGSSGGGGGSRPSGGGRPR